MRTNCKVASILLSPLLFLLVTTAQAEGIHVITGGPAYLSAGLGVFNGVGIHPEEGPNPRVPEINLEYQSASKLFGIGSAWGLMANTRGGFMGYGGFYSDIAWDRWVLTPMLGFGGYDAGQGKQLGSIFEFRLELGLAYQFQNGGRLGLKIAHISNAYIVPQDPGENEALITYSFPLSFGDHS